MVPQLHRPKMSRRLGLANSHDRVHRRRPTRMFLRSLESLEDRTLLSLLNPTWVPEGPGPRINATATVPAQQNSAVGAVNTVAFLNANTALAATVNGGIWRTSNFNAPTPAWTPVSDSLSSLSFTAIAVSPLTKRQPINQQVVFAGTGANSSFTAYYGKAAGLFKSLDGGQTWQPTGTLAGSNGTINPFAGQTISSIVPGLRDPGTNQQVVLVGADNGLWRSADGGATFSQIFSGKITSIVADPSDSSGMTYFAVAVRSGLDSVGKSTDGGKTWQDVTPSFPFINGQQLTQQANLQLAVSPNTSASTRALYAGLVTTSLSPSSFGQPVNASIVNSFNAYTINAPNHGLTTGDFVQVKYTYNNVDTWWWYQVTVQDVNNFTIADRSGPALATIGATLTFYKYANVNITGPNNGTYTVTAWNHGLSNGAVIQVLANNNTGYYLFPVTVQDGNTFTFQNGNSPAPQTGQVTILKPFTASVANIFTAYTVSAPGHGLQTGNGVRLQSSLNAWNYQITVWDNNTFTIADPQGPTLPLGAVSYQVGQFVGRALVYQSTTQGSTWQQASVDPTSQESSGPQPLFGATQNRGMIQANNFALAVDPTNRDIVYVSGASQPFSRSAVGNVLWTGRIFRGDLSNINQASWTQITNYGNQLSAPVIATNVDTTQGLPILFQSPGHGLSTGDEIAIAGGPFGNSQLTFASVTVVDPDSFTIDGSSGNGVPVTSRVYYWRVLNSSIVGSVGTAPHADSRSMVFSPSGNLVETDDGGIYVRSNPTSSTGNWSAANGNLADSELTGIAYDSLNNLIIGGSQDNGVAAQSGWNDPQWNAVLQADGNIPAVDNFQTMHPGTSIYYYSTQFLGQFTRQTRNSSNQVLGTVNPALRVTGPGIPSGATLRTLTDDSFQFYNPFVVDSVPSATETTGWLLLGMTNYLYVSTNGGDDWTRVSSALPGPPTAFSFGGMVNGVASRSVAYVGVSGGTTRLYARTQSGGAFLPVSGYKGGTPRSIAVDPDNWLRVYIADANGKIWMTTNGGGSFSDITGNLVPSGTVSASNYSDFALAVYDLPPTLGVNENSDDVVFVGGWGGVWAAENPQTGIPWTRFGTSMPNVLVNGLVYNSTDNLLLASTLGRGAWEVTNLSASVFQPEIELPGQPAAAAVPGPQSTFSDTPLVFSTVNGNAISITDPGAPAANNFMVTLSVTNGDLTLATLDGLDAPDDAGASSVKKFEGTLDQINAALDGLTFHASGFSSRSMLTVSVDDQRPDGNRTDTETVAIQDLPRTVTHFLSVPVTVAANSQGPVIAVPAGPLNAGINSGGLSISGITLSDAGNLGGPETLTVYVQGGSLTFSNNATLSDGDTFGPITDTLANLNRYFENNGASVSFTPTPDSQGTAWILITLDNGTQTSSNPATAWIPIGVAAPPPTVAAPASLNTRRNSPIAFASLQAGNITVGDSDPLSQSLEVFVAAANGLVSLPNAAGIAVIAGDPTGDYFLDITGTPDAINTALASMIYTPNSGFRGYDSLSIDVVNTGALSDITAPPFTESTDDGDSSDASDVLGGVAGDMPIPLAPGTPVNWDASLVTTTISILVDDPPVAVTAGGPYTIAAGGSLALSGSAYDPDGIPVTYSWRINGQSADSITGASPTLSWAQLRALGITGAGTYSVTVSADDGLADPVSSVPVTLTVLPVAPVLSSVSATPASAIGTSLLTGAIDEPDPSESFTLVVSWGDGSVSTTSLPAGATSFQVGHQYAVNPSRPASLPILAVLRDTSGLTGSAQTTVDLHGVVTVIGPGAGVSGQPLTFTADVPPGGLPGASLQWDFGDGQVSPVFPAGASLMFAHAYAAPGRYSASLKIITGDRVESSPVTVNVQRVIQVADPLGGTDLILGGTPGNDVFRLRSVRGGGISAVINGQPVGGLFRARAVIIYGDGGRDRVVRRGRFPVQLVRAKPRTLGLPHALRRAMLGGGTPSTPKR